MLLALMAVVGVGACIWAAPAQITGSALPLLGINSNTGGYTGTGSTYTLVD